MYACFFSGGDLLDEVDAFHAAYRHGRLVPAPEDYTDLILIPAILHIDPLTFAQYPPLIQRKMRMLLGRFMAVGQLDIMTVGKPNA